MANKEDVYITKDGDILRGDAATDSLLQKDAEELLKKTGLESHTERSKQKSYTLRLRPTAKKSVQKTDLSNCGKTSINPHDISLNVLQTKASATGAKLSAWQHEVTGLTADAGVELSAGVTGAQVKVATTEIKAPDISVNACAGVDIRGMQVRVLNASAKGVKGQVETAVKVSATGADVRAGNADLAVVDANLEAQISATAKGVSVQAANAKIAGVQASAYAQAKAEATGVNITAAKAIVAGVQASAYAEAKAEATGADITAAKAKITGVESERRVSASAEAKGVSVSAATANIVGIQDKKVAKTEAVAKGPEVNVAQFSAVGKKTGGSVDMTAETRLGQLQAGTVSLTGIDNTISASARLKSDIGSLRAANVNAAASGGANFEATADLSLGVDVGNLEIGSSKGGSIGVSTRFQAGNIVLSSGLPSLTLAPSLNFGFGGGSRSSGSRGGKPKGGSHSSRGVGTTGDSGSAGGAPNGGGSTVGASTASGGYSSRLSDNSGHRSSADVYSGGTLADVSYSRGSSILGKRLASYSGGLGGKSAYSGASSYSSQPGSHSQTNGGSDGARKQSHNPVHSAHGLSNRQPGARPYTHSGSAGLRHRHRATTQKLMPVHSPKSDYGVVPGGSWSMPGNSHTSSGFGSTHRRHSCAENVSTETKRTYGERLASMLNQKVSTLAPNGAETDCKKDKKKKDVTVSKDREEAKRELSQALSKVREKLDEEDRSKSASATGAILKSGGNGKDGEPGTKVDSEDKKEKVTAPKEKPFGSKKNIHTLGCFKNESTREVLNIGGNVHGFDT